MECVEIVVGIGVKVASDVSSAAGACGIWVGIGWWDSEPRKCQESMTGPAIGAITMGSEYDEQETRSGLWHCARTKPCGTSNGRSPSDPKVSATRIHV
jgi:hypothetical protein